LFARAFNSSSMETGIRKEMAVVDGFKFGNVGWTALLQSKWSVTSWSAQYFRSASSLEKCGVAILLFLGRLFTGRPFSPTHVSRRNNSNQVSPNRKDDREQTVRVSFSKRGKAQFLFRMLFIWSNHDRTIEKSLFCFAQRDLVKLPILVCIAIVPLKSCAMRKGVRKVRHDQRIYQKYTPSRDLALLASPSEPDRPRRRFFHTAHRTPYRKWKVDDSRTCTR